MTDLTEFKPGAADHLLPADFSENRFRNFVAIQDVPPQKTLFLHVTGEILVGNPGIDIELTYAEPQGINPRILVLTVQLNQRPGFWPQVMTWKKATYNSGMIQYNQYSDVQLDGPFGTYSVKVIDRA